MAEIEKDTQATRRDDIALMALEIFLEKGYAGTSLSAVAQAAGIRKPTLYHHFASKEELFLAALAADVAAPLARVRALLDEAAGTPQERFREALGLFHDAMVGSAIGSLAAVISETSRTVPAVAAGFHARFIMVFEGELAEAYAPCVAEGSHRDVPPSTVSHIVFGPLLSIAMSEVMFAGVPTVSDRWPGGRSRPEFVDMVDGLLRSPGPAQG
jgi:AcrR family transcriptional regulator